MYNEEKQKKKNRKETNKISLWSRFFHKRTKRLLTNIDRLFTKIMWIEIGISVALVIIGVIFLLKPDLSVKILSVLFGMGILSFGGLNIYCYIKRREIPMFRFHLVYGIVALILGIITILNPFTFSQVVTLFIGLWIIYLAILKIDLAIHLHQISESSWLLIFVSAILEIFMGILIFINPFSNLLITQVAGAYFILCGVLNCTDAVLTKNRAIDFLENI